MFFVHMRGRCVSFLHLFRVGVCVVCFERFHHRVTCISRVYFSWVCASVVFFVVGGFVAAICCVFISIVSLEVLCACWVACVFGVSFLGGGVPLVWLFALGLCEC